MTEQRVSLRYAKAIFDTAKIAGSIDLVYNDFLKISEYLNISGELLAVLKSPVITSWRKAELFKNLFNSLVSELTYDFLMLLVEKERENYIPDIISVYERLYFKEKNIIKADVTTSREMDDVLKEKILSKLSSKLSKTVIPTFKVDPLIKGGIMIRVEDWVFDATIRNQLALLRTRLIEGKLV